MFNLQFMVITNVLGVNLRMYFLVCSFCFLDVFSVTCRKFLFSGYFSVAWRKYLFPGVFSVASRKYLLACSYFSWMFPDVF